MTHDYQQYRSKYWATLNEWFRLGLRVRERPADVPEWMTAAKIVGDDPLEPIRVFNAEQVEGPGLEEYLVPTPYRTERIDYSAT